MINILLIEDSAVFVMGLKMALSAENGFTVAGTATTPGSAVAFLNAHPQTDVAVEDISPESETDGRCLFFGETIDSAKIVRLFGDDDNLRARKPQGLTPREMEVLQLTTSGYSNAQIASALEITVNTVDSYKERIKGKFGLDSIVECVAHAVSDGLVIV